MSSANVFCPTTGLYHLVDLDEQPTVRCPGCGAQVDKREALKPPSPRPS